MFFVMQLEIRSMELSQPWLLALFLSLLAVLLIFQNLVCATDFNASPSPSIKTKLKPTKQKNLQQPIKKPKTKTSKKNQTKKHNQKTPPQKNNPKIKIISFGPICSMHGYKYYWSAREKECKGWKESNLYDISMICVLTFCVVCVWTRNWGIATWSWTPVTLAARTA